MSKKVAVVTGSNKGIGYAIVKGLCQKFFGTVYLTARDVERGQTAVQELNKIGLKAEFHQLDITDPKSVEVFRDFLKEKHGGIDILINNAAIAFKQDATEPKYVQAKETIFVNYFSLVSFCNTFFPIIRNGGRVVNLSSLAGHLSMIPGEDIRKRFSSKDLTVDEISALMQEFVDSTKDGTHVEKGWGEGTYVVSKVGVSALTFVQQRELDSRDIKVNCVHPGYVDTDMSSHKGHLTTEQGADAALYLALEAPEDVKGVYMWHDRKIVDWYAPTCPGIYE